MHDQDTTRQSSTDPGLVLQEQRRQAYLQAMQVTCWLPRTDLPFAAPSRPEIPIGQIAVEVDAVEPEVARNSQDAVSSAEAAALPAEPVIRTSPRPVVDVRKASNPVSVEPDEASSEPVAPAPQAQPIPHFSLQLMRAGDCLLMVELPTGEAFQSRDPAYVLLRDLLLAAGLPDSPHMLGDPVRWPLLASGNVEQGPQQALEFVQSYLMARLEEQACCCIWLVGLPAIRYAADGDEHDYLKELPVEGLGVAWAIPGLELLMEEPWRKAALWQAMRRVRQRWLDLADE